MEYRFANIDDVDKIMKFIDEFWKKGHILSKNRELFLYDFLEGEKINIGLVLDKDILAGIFGFIKYNYTNISDLAGSLWKIRDDYSYIPLLGLKLRKFVLDNTKHRFFAAPGANIDTKVIYDLLGEEFYKLNQWYILNNNIKKFKIANNIPKQKKHFSFQFKNNVKLLTILDLDGFHFNKNLYPYKDKEYIVKRFFNYPFYKYEIFGVFKDGLKIIFVGREVQVKEAKAYRIVDFYGDEEYINDMEYFLLNLINDRGYEYVDFLEYGLNSKKFKVFSKRADDIIIPQYFEPFVRENKDIFGVAYKGFKFRQFKADGDQDRPNEIRKIK